MRTDHDFRRWTVRRLGAGRGPSGPPPRIAADSRFADLRDDIPDAGGAPPAPADPHPSWTIRALRSLPAAVARAWADRLPPDVAAAARQSLPGLAGGRPAATTPLVETLVARARPGPFPPPPAWARPATAAASVAQRLEAEGTGPGGMPALPDAETPIPEPAETPIDAPTRRGLTRIAWALLDSPAEAWGIAGASAFPVGAFLLEAWNRWPDLAAGDGREAPRRARARERLAREWSRWAE
jgi:hypothetical protein